MQTDMYQWKTTPPTADDVSSHEFWYRRVWISMNDYPKAEPIVNIYQVMYTTEGGMQAHLSGCGEIIAVNEIAEDEAVEWQPVMAPQGDSAATKSVEIVME